MKIFSDNSNRNQSALAMRSACKDDLFASIVVFLVALPLCMGIAVASGVPVATGLVTGIVGGIVAGLFAGAPLQVSGPAAGLTIVVYELVQNHGWESLGIAVLIGGSLQFIAGVLRLGQWFRAVSPAVVQGMLAGIGILIFSSQFHVMVDDLPKENGLRNFVTIPQAVQKGLPWPEWRNETERQLRTQLLKEVGTLHYEQELLQKSLAEISVTPSDQVNNKSWESVASRHEKVNGQIQKLAAGLKQYAASTAGFDKSGELNKTATQASEHSGANLLHIRNGEIERAHQLSLKTQESLADLQSQLKDHAWAAKIGLLTIVILVLWKMAAPRRLQLIPPPLVAITLMTVLAATLQLPVLYVEVPDNLWNDVRFPTPTNLRDIPFAELFKIGVVIAVVASAETLLCATAVDQLQQRSRTNYDRELTAQGIGNMICGMLGALPMTGVIVRSAANIDAGARTRLSTILHGFWLLLFVSVFAFLLRMIPTAALAAMLVYTGYKLVNLQALRQLRDYGVGEVAVYAVTLITIVAVDLLTGVVVGLLVSAAKLLYRFCRLRTSLAVHDDGARTILKIDGVATFLRFASACQRT